MEMIELKKIIWVFGQPGSGRTTFNNKVLNKSKDISMIIDSSMNKCDLINYPYDRDVTLFDDELLISRQEEIYQRVKKFENDDYDALIINGEFTDFCGKHGDILDMIGNDYPNIDKEILFQRFIQKPWFKKNEEKNRLRYPYSWLLFSSEVFINHLEKFEELGYTFYEIDTTDGYEVKEKNGIKLEKTR